MDNTLFKPLRLPLAGVLSLLPGELPGVRFGEPTAHQPHLNWFHRGGFHRRHSAVLQQL